jgi:hypothetical protein
MYWISWTSISELFNKNIYFLIVYKGFNIYSNSYIKNKVFLIFLTPKNLFKNFILIYLKFFLINQNFRLRTGLK